MSRGHPVVRLVGINRRDAARFDSVFYHRSSIADPPSSTQATESQPSAGENKEQEARGPTSVCVKGANCGQLDVQQNREPEDMLQHFIDRGVFRTDPLRVPACAGGELALPLIDENCAPVSQRQRTFTPQEVDMIRVEIGRLTERGIIRPSNLKWAHQVICVRKSDGTLRFCVDWRKLTVLLKTYSGGLLEGDMRRTFSGLRGKTFSTQIDNASGFHQITIAEKYRPETTFHDADGQLHEFNRAGLGLTALPAVFTRVVKRV